MSQKKRKVQDGIRGKTEKPRKRFRKQLEYHSSSEESDGEEGFAAVDLNDTDDEAEPTDSSKRTKVPADRKTAPKTANDDAEVEEEELSKDAADEEEVENEEEVEEEDVGDGDDDDEEDDDEDDIDGGAKRRPTNKRNDPSAFSTSISKILSTKLSRSARKDPLLSRSKEAAETGASLANERLERRAKAKLRAERKDDLQRGRITDVLGLNSGQAGEIAEEEKRLRKIAQRGVVKLFNAVRAAQVKAEQAAKEERKKGTIGITHRQEKVNEMSKQGFLDLIGGKKGVQTASAS